MASIEAARSTAPALRSRMNMCCAGKYSVNRTTTPSDRNRHVRGASLRNKFVFCRFQFCLAKIKQLIRLYDNFLSELKLSARIPARTPLPGVGTSFAHSPISQR